ncbi:MAG TPA: HD domain-containing protein, partial [Ideonella sp.]|nr:HD domain-containing protein [Ideonella sp.]
ARMDAPLAVRFACLCHDLGKGTTPPAEWPRHIAHEARSETLARALAERLKAPADATELAGLVAREHTNIHRSPEFGAAAVVRLLERCDAFRRPDRFTNALMACEADARGRLGLEDQPYLARPRLLVAYTVAAAVPTAPIAEAAAARGAQGPAIAEAIHQARVNAVEEQLAQYKADGEAAAEAASRQSADSGDAAITGS